MQAIADASSSGPVSPLLWGRTLSGPPMLSSDAAAWSGGLLRRWRDVAPDIEQPALDHHYVVMHLGGPKRIQRRGEGALACADLPCGALSTVPAGAAFSWSTRGPIDFAHLYFEPARLNRLAAEEFDRPGGSAALIGRLGFDDPLLRTLFVALLEQVGPNTVGGRLDLDSLLHVFGLHLLHRHADLNARALRAAHALQPYRLRRVLEYVEAHLGDDITLAHLAAVAGASPFHFSRAFAAATGQPPYAYVLHRRVERAKTILRETDRSFAAIARDCGFGAPAQFSRTFKRLTGRTPSRYRRSD